MPKGPAARTGDPTQHGPPLNPGPGSSNVIIGNQPAWRALPAAAAAAFQAAQQAADIAVKAAEKAREAASGTPGAPAAITAEATAKATALGAGAAAASAAASLGVDVHNCPIIIAGPAPAPHGPGMVIDGSATVLINFLPASREGDTVLEMLGGPDKIQKGCSTVIIGG